ncbi:hypothetical protein ABIC63_002109 [Pseudacidovorax sp. 1753]|uniref:hypothetical protein n=1 Tax=Pseudacidovorax sp. 1753 TaxID=3156419 RepID=UPI0033956D65
MTGVRIRRPDVEETGLSEEEMLLALREGVMPVGESDAMIIVTAKAPRVLHITARRRQPAWSAVDGASEARGAT